MNSCTNIFIRGTMVTANCETGNFYQDTNTRVCLSMNTGVCHAWAFVGILAIYIMRKCLEQLRGMACQVRGTWRLAGPGHQVFAGEGEGEGDAPPGVHRNLR